MVITRKRPCMPLFFLLVFPGGSRGIVPDSICRVLGVGPGAHLQRGHRNRPAVRYYADPLPANIPGTGDNRQWPLAAVTALALLGVISVAFLAGPTELTAPQRPIVHGAWQLPVYHLGHTVRDCFVGPSGCIDRRNHYCPRRPGGRLAFGAAGLLSNWSAPACSPLVSMGSWRGATPC